MKEQNLLIFRDYSVKLGDFGISIKLKHNDDPDEEHYELRGLTKGYTIQSIAENGTEKNYSKNDLLMNDYYAIFKTFT